ncbi:MAG: hypothetical protein HYW62_00785 [Candidatus Levybacteria bacterium]|nr:hypothetical protein [Candidatus Levybacteria bacterium]
MDITILGKTSIKLKGKRVSFIVDPAKDILKTSADAVILLNGQKDIDTSRVTDSRIIINGAGGYEIGGVKISGTTTDKGTLYKISMEDILVIVGRSAETKADGFNACQIAIVNTENDFNESFVTPLEPRLVVLYGEKKTESAKALGAESISSVTKITITKDKLPEKMEIVVLG